MLKRFFRITLALALLGLNVLPVVASDTGIITVTASPLVGAGISDFTITYINDTQLDLSWVLGPGTANIMIRSKYGGYPADIPDINTAPSDGDLVYYGNALAFSDTSMDFNQNPGPIYYRAWAQKGDGTWVLTPAQGLKESLVMLLLGLVAIIGVISFLSYKSRNILPSLVAFAMWIGMWYYIQATYSATLGQNVVTIILLVCIGVGAYLCFRCFQDRDVENRNPFKDAPNTVRSVSVQPQAKKRGNERETPEEYRLRARRALNSHRG